LGETQPPPAEGVRLDWQAVPAQVRAAVEGWLESPVVSAASQPMGFSPGVAARLRTADDRCVFVKAAGPKPNPGVPAIHRREAQITALLPDSAPVPRLLWSYDDSEWVVLAFEQIDGQHPAQPWRTDELDRVLDALVFLADVLTPSPLPPGTVGSASAEFASRMCGWRQLHDERSSWLDQLDVWSVRHLQVLAEIEAGAAAAVDGNTLLHFDVRADNILLTTDRVWFVDWPLACVGAAWVDVVFFAPSVRMQGGPPPEEVITRHPACRAADPDAITAAVAAVAGFFTLRALEPPPPGLPTVRAFQAAQGVVAREWLAERTGLD
jgi:hypothetical protein